MVDQSAAPVATTHQELTLDLNADVAEWCPAPSSARRLLAAGTYQLNEATQQREGRLYFYRLKGEIVRNDQSLSLDPASTTDIPGIFDLRWRPDAAQPTLAAALADGSLRIMNVDATESGGDVVVEEVGRAESPDGGMALSVEWQRRGGAEPQLTSSYSDGLVAVHQVGHKINPESIIFCNLKDSTLLFSYRLPPLAFPSCTAGLRTISRPGRHHFTTGPRVWCSQAATIAPSRAGT